MNKTEFKAWAKGWLYYNFSVDEGHSTYHDFMNKVDEIDNPHPSVSVGGQWTLTHGTCICGGNKVVYNISLQKWVCLTCGKPYIPELKVY